MAKGIIIGISIAATAWQINVMAWRRGDVATYHQWQHGVWQHQA